MNRREFITVLGGAAAAWPLAARAQQPSKLPTIGFLGAATASAWHPWTAVFVQRLGELGWIEGRTVAIEYRWAEGRPERYAEIAARVRPAQGRCHCHGGKRSLRCKAGDIGHPHRLCAGERPGWRRPGREPVATGRQRHRTVEPGADLAGKRIELLREIRPDLRRLAILANVGHRESVLEMDQVQAAVRSLGIEVAKLEIRRAEDISPAFESLKGQADALYVVVSALVAANRTRIITFALSARLPTSFNTREYVEAGALMSYGPNFLDLFRRTAEIVDKILRGAKPADIPVEQPTKFDLVINLSTAKALGLDSAADAARPRRRGDRMRAARVHHAARRRGGRVAACGARAGEGQTADHRVLRKYLGIGRRPMDRRLRPASGRARLDQWPHRDDRVSLGGGAERNLCRSGCRVCPAQG